MNEMRKLMEAINTINEGDVSAELALSELKAAMDAWHNAITKFQGIYDPSTVGLEGWMESNFDTMFDLESELDDPMDEAYQGGKTEHAGAKKSKGAFYGRKKEAKRDSNKNRRRAGKEASLGEDIDPKTGDIRTYDRNDAEFMQDIISLTNEADEVMMDEDRNPAEQLDGLAVIVQDISNITRLRASGRPYAPIHESEYNNEPVKEEPGDSDHGYNYEGPQAGDFESGEETYRGISLPRDYRTENIVIMPEPEKNGGVEIYGHSEWLEDGVPFSKNEWEDLVNLIKRHKL